MSEDIVRGLLRLIGWELRNRSWSNHVGLLRCAEAELGRDRELTDDEAETILEVAATQPVSASDRARLRERVLNRRFGPVSEEPTPAGQCSRCQRPIPDFLPPDESETTAGYYVAAGWPEYANPGEVYICDNCMWADPRYIAVYGPRGSAGGRSHE